jgi:hypothetical protein
MDSTFLLLLLHLHSPINQQQQQSTATTVTPNLEKRRTSNVYKSFIDEISLIAIEESQ